MVFILVVVVVYFSNRKWIIPEWPPSGDSCKGDSGSGLVVADKDNKKTEDEPEIFTAVGIYSMGGAKCKGELPGVFTNISTYGDWGFLGKYRVEI